MVVESRQRSQGSLPSAAEVLIVLGADTTIELNSGKTPIEVARLGCKFLKL
jgi:hypothetical protein